MRKIQIKDFEIGDKKSLPLISGPCVIESLDHALFTAEALLKITDAEKIPFVYKSSYDKANRSSIKSYRGPGCEEGLSILRKVKERLDIPIMTDVHTPKEAQMAAEVCDILQVPAFLCRQTDLLIACAKTDAVINVKKGQFMAPNDMINVIEKLIDSGTDKILLCERGSTFGYHNLVSDMRSIPIMQSLGYPVCYDGSHSIQLPGGLGTMSGGQREFIPHLCSAAVAAGCDLLYIESHPEPKEALCDSASVYPLAKLPSLIRQVKRIFEVVNCVT